MKFKILMPIFILFSSFSLYSTTYYSIYHTVKKGENLSVIAKKYGKTVDELKKMNNLKTSGIFPGQKLVVDRKEKILTDEKNKEGKLTEEKKGEFVKEFYTVKKGDSLYKISKKFGLTVSQLKKMNNLKTSTVHPEQKLVVGMRRIDTAVKKEINPDEITPIVDVCKKTYYKVCDGDTIESISEKFGIEPEKLLQANLIKKEDLRVGQILVIPPKDLLDQETKVDTGLNDQSNVRIKLIEEALSYLGTKYRYGGESKSGLDCSALTRLVYKTLGILLPQNSSLQYKNGIQIDKEEALPGDLVFFRRGSGIGHVGIYLGNDLFVHASYTLRRVVISSLSERYFRERFAGFRRYLVDEETYFVKGIENVEQE